MSELHEALRFLRRLKGSPPLCLPHVCRASGSQQRRSQADDSNNVHGKRRHGIQDIAARYHVNTGGNHGGRMDKG